MKRILANVWVASLVLVLIVGCGGGAKETPAPAQPTQAPAAAQQPTAAPAATPAPAATQAPAPAAAAEAEEELTVEDRQSGLKQLDSYRARWDGAWKGVDGDEATDVKWEWFQEYTSDPEALYMRMNGFDFTGSEKAVSIEMWRIGETTYMLTTEDGSDPQCISISSTDQDPIDQSIFDPGSLGRVEGAKYAGTDTVNGIRAKHYTYNEKAASFLGAAKASGDLWVAVDGGYVIKETVTWEGSGGMFGAESDAAGQGSWTWEILEVNPKLTITPPPDCESAASGLPVLPDATDKTQVGDMLAYKTATPLADVAAFYQDEMAKAGWAAEGESQVTDQFAILNFAMDGQTAQIMLSPEDDKTSVVIMIQK